MSLRSVPVLLLVSTFAGCAASKAAEPSPQAPPTDREPRLTDVDALEHDLNVAEQRLDAEVDKKLAVVGSASRDREDDSDEPAQGPEKKNEESELPARSGPRAAADSTVRGGTRARVSTPCDHACRALASMKRSAARICELTGETSARCGAAKDRVERAAQRVVRAGCACRER